MESLAGQVADLNHRFQFLRHELSDSPPPSPITEPKVNNPPRYSGEPTECKAFLTQCEVIFSLQPSTYAADRARIAFVISLLTGRARGLGYGGLGGGGRMLPVFHLL